MGYAQDFPLNGLNAVKSGAELGYALRANLAGWDNDPRPQVRAEEEMTFTYAVIADGGIVLAADSQMTHTHRDQFGDVIGTYEGRLSKIKRLKGRFAFSMAGNAGFADTLLSQVDETQVERWEDFDEVVKLYQAAFQSLMDKQYREQRMQARSFGVAFLFCGFVGRRIPRVWKLDIALDFVPDPITSRGYLATGAERHGAAFYLQNRFYRDGMPLEQAKLLAYCIAKEVAEQDTLVGGPIEMEVITHDKSEPLLLEEIQKYEAARQQMISGVRSFLGAFQ